MAQSTVASVGLGALLHVVKRVLVLGILGISLQFGFPLFANAATSATSTFTVSAQVIASCALSSNLLQAASVTTIPCASVAGVTSILPVMPRTIMLPQDGPDGRQILMIEF